MNSNHTPSPKQLVSAYIRMLDSEPAQKIAQACLDPSSGVTFDDLKRYAYGHPKIEEIERYFGESFSKQETIDELYSDWYALLDSKGIIHGVDMLNRFLLKWATSHMPLAQSLIKQCDKVLDLAQKYDSQLENLSLSDMIEREWIETCEKNDVVAYHYFIEHYTYCKYSNEAKEKFLSLKKELLVDLIRRPFYYSREAMYSYISNGVLTYDDLVVKSKILDDAAYKHIKTYPRSGVEIDAIPYWPKEVEMPKRGNIDVYSFGVCGSGGKTSLLASIMTLFNNKTFVLHESYGAGYARYLSDCMFRNALPPGTDTSCIHVINTSLLGNNVWHGVSFVEFSGEKATDIAGDDGTMFVSCNAGENYFKLLNNTNRKILLFAIDLSISKNLIQLDYSDEADCQYVFQSDIAELWAYRLKKDKEFCKKIVAIKIVVTKKVLNGGSPK